MCDAWSIDYKGLRDKVCNYIGVNGEKYYDNMVKSIKDIIQHNLPLEIRTTYFKNNIKDKNKIRENIKKIEDYMNTNKYTAYYKYFEQDDFRDKIKKNIS